MMSQDQAHGYHEAPPSDCPTENWKRVEIHGTDDVYPVRKALAAEMTARGYPRKDIFAVDLALGEAVVNAIKHGHGGDTRRSE